MYLPCTESESIFNLPNHSDEKSVETSSHTPSNAIDDEIESTVIVENEDNKDDDDNLIKVKPEDPQDLCRSDDKVRCSKTSSFYICDVQKCDGSRDCPGGEDEENCPKDDSNPDEGSGEEGGIEQGIKDGDEGKETSVPIGSEESPDDKSSGVTEGELLKTYDFMCCRRLFSFHLVSLTNFNSVHKVEIDFDNFVDPNLHCCNHTR